MDLHPWSAIILVRVCNVQYVLEANVRVYEYAEAERSVHDWVEGTGGERRNCKRNQGGGHQPMTRFSDQAGGLQTLGAYRSNVQ